MKGIYHLADSYRLYGGLAQWMEAQQRRAAAAARCRAQGCVQARRIMAPTPIPLPLAREWFGVELAGSLQPPSLPENVRLLLSVATPLLDSRRD